MAEVKFYKDFVNTDFTTVNIESGTVVKDVVKKYSEINDIANLVECYDPETGETFFAPLSEDSEINALIIVNEQIVDPNYKITENDIIDVFFLPFDENFSKFTWKKFWSGVVGLIGGAFAGALTLSELGPVGIVAGAIIGGGLGFLGGWTLGENVSVGIPDYSRRPGQKTIEGEKELEASPDVRGANNERLVGNVYPYVLGKHIITPFIVGDPITEYTGPADNNLGQDAYISLLLCAGYGPLKLTDFKMGDYFLAYNRTQGGNERQTLLRGILKGYSKAPNKQDSGDILDIWKSNDITLEIIQNKQGEPLNRGSVYSRTKIDKKINAQVLFVADKIITDLAPVVYKGASFPNNFKTNNVYFTEACPLKFTLNLSAPNGLFRSRSISSESSTRVVYEKIPLWYCVQWRVYHKDNPSSDSNGGDLTNASGTQKTLWHDITVFNDKECGYDFTEEERISDLKNHTGNHPDDLIAEGDINKNFVGHKLCNFKQDFTGEDRVVQMRLSSVVEITDPKDIEDLTNTETNPAKIVEVRILRVSPSYINEVNSSGDYGPYNYSDVLGVESLMTEVFDEEVYKARKEIVPVYAIPRDEDLEKFCYIAIKAKADLNGFVTQAMKRISCMAEAFAPQWDSENKHWIPEVVNRIKKCYGYYSKDVDKSRIEDINYRVTVKDKRVRRSSDAVEVEVTYQEYIDARSVFLNWIETSKGSNYAQIIKDRLFDTSNGTNCYLKDSDIFLTGNSSASAFMLSLVGPQNGIVALGYGGTDSGVNELSVGEWAEDCIGVKDGSTDEKGNEVLVDMKANAYIFRGYKLEDLLGKITITGRAIYNFDNFGKIKVIMDKPVDYPVGVINDQNTISGQDTYSYEEPPAGLVIQFSDENDGFEKNTVYCWSDGNSYNNYKGQVMTFGVDFVTNPRQIWSLGRYFLANSVVGKEVITRKIGLEGNLYSLGDVVLVQSESLLIGDGAARVQEVIESEGKIYGFISDGVYEYTGEKNDKGEIIQGVSIFQPTQLGKSKIVTLRLASEDFSLELDSKTYQMKKGSTNLCLFESPIDRTQGNDFSSTVNKKYIFTTGDICYFGEFEKTAAPYRIIKIKQDSEGTFTETLTRYDESIYNYGAELPSFQNYNKTVPVQKDPISLSDVPSNLLELNNSNKGDTDLIYNKIDGLTSNRVVNLYRRSKTLLTEDDLPKTPMEYDFTTDALNPSSIDGWNFDYRTASQGEGSMFFTSATAFGKGTKYLIQPEKWNPPIVFGANGADGISGLNGLTIFIEKPALTFDSLDVEGNVSERIILDRVHMEVDGDPVPFTIGNVKAANLDVKGFDFSVYGEEVVIKVLPGAEMAKNGFILVPIISKNIIEKDYLIDEDNKRYVDENGHTYGTFKQGDEDVEYKLYVSYAKAEKGEQGDKGEKGDDGKDGEQGPSYLGMFDKPAAEVGTDFPIGSWYLNTVDGKIYLRQKNEAEPWIDLKLLLGPEKYYSDYRVQAAINDIFTITTNNEDKYPDLVVAANLWCQNLVANQGFIKTLASQNIILKNPGSIESENYEKLKSGTIIKSDGYLESQNALIRGKIYATEGSFKGKIEADSGYFNGDITSKNFFDSQNYKTSNGYNLNGDNGVIQANEIVLSKDFSIPGFALSQKGLTDNNTENIVIDINAGASIVKRQLDKVFDQFSEENIVSSVSGLEEQCFCTISIGDDREYICKSLNGQKDRLGIMFFREKDWGGSWRKYSMLGEYQDYSERRVIYEDGLPLLSPTLANILIVSNKLNLIKFTVPMVKMAEFSSTMGYHWSKVGSGITRFTQQQLVIFFRIQKCNSIPKSFVLHFQHTPGTIGVNITTLVTYYPSDNGTCVLEMNGPERGENTKLIKITSEEDVTYKISGDIYKLVDIYQ